MSRAPARHSRAGPAAMAGDKTPPETTPTVVGQSGSRWKRTPSADRSVGSNSLPASQKYTPPSDCANIGASKATPPSDRPNIGASKVTSPSDLANIGASKSTPRSNSELKNDDSSSDSTQSLGLDVAATHFDICSSQTKCSVKLKLSLLEINREKRKGQGVPQVLNLRPGMLLFRNFIEQADQVSIVKACQVLGKGNGGFYTPGYRDGAKLRLKMMCLGKNWNPDLGSYEDIRSFDGSEPPAIPDFFLNLVNDALKASHNFIRQNGTKNAEEELPLISPDICIVNFYQTNGRLGLHQDKDESHTSLSKGLPVVSFSIGDKAEFLYGDNKDENVSSKVELESGDVLLFGGKSRHIFHGVSSIKSETAPKWLIQETNLKPGRLNLTFRQY